MPTDFSRSTILPQSAYQPQTTSQRLSTDAAVGYRHNPLLGKYIGNQGALQLVLPPDVSMLDRAAEGVGAVFEERFSRFGEPLWVVFDPTLDPRENIRTGASADAPRVALNEPLREAERERRIARLAAQGGVLFGLLVNPETLALSGNKSVTPQFARGGWTISQNYTEQLQLALSGRTRAFYTLMPEGAAQIGGLTRQGRLWSAGYRNLLDLVALVKNNGTVRSEGERGRIQRVLSAVILYDGWTFIGSFRSLGINEDAQTPFALQYDIQFAVQDLYHETWPALAGVPGEVRVPDDLRRTETPEWLVGVTEKAGEAQALRDSAQAMQAALDRGARERLAEQVYIDQVLAPDLEPGDPGPVDFGAPGEEDEGAVEEPVPFEVLPAVITPGPGQVVEPAPVPYPVPYSGPYVVGSAGGPPDLTGVIR